MTLSKYRPLRTYDEQWIVDATDVHGLLKDVDAAVQEYGENGLVDTLYFEGVQDALETLFVEGGVDNRLDFMMEIIRRKNERRG